MNPLWLSLAAFIASAGILTITPGVDTTLVLRSAVSGGRRSAVGAGVGVTLGLLAWGASAAIGLRAILAASKLAFLKWAGAAYLLWLGVGLLLAPRSTPPLAGTGNAAPGAGGHVTSHRRGFLTNVLNPKVGVFYIAFLPQFIAQHADIALFCFALAAIRALLTAIWFAAIIAFTFPLQRFFQRKGVVPAMDRPTGGVFVAFGVRLALSRQA